MIATLEGIVSEKLTDVVVLDVQGVGYGVYTSLEDYSKLISGESVKLYIYEHVREQAHDLFGFLQRDTKGLFEQLLEVSGVGPKMALNMLSVGSGEALKQAIASGDTKFIAQASGVGKRLAERVVVELKDKVGLIGVDLATTGLLTSEAAIAGDEAAEGLVALGYTVADATLALKGIDTELPTTERIKQALKEVAK